MPELPKLDEAQIEQLVATYGPRLTMQGLEDVARRLGMYDEAEFWHGTTEKLIEERDRQRA